MPEPQLVPRVLGLSLGNLRFTSYHALTPAGSPCVRAVDGRRLTLHFRASFENEGCSSDFHHLASETLVVQPPSIPSATFSCPHGIDYGIRLYVDPRRYEILLSLYTLWQYSM
ncbi:hypothetical protein PoB_001565600 [Plakobranchus ocellatus]|uniref:CUB domain-containing protein n=1 Tax=Plakobranchus ocellatus TaxID=259542 RepID=A0AAV3YPS9_9GAST|nr:hypothetical protein PoB_001565600 [Plakobranchus ocellatus]